MASAESATSRSEDTQSVSSLSISLPKGGGAIRGMGEKFAANPVTGTGSMSVPIATSPGRSGFGPALSLSYDSGAGNGPFGFGWSLSTPAITRKTDKGLPQYHDASESDVFILSGAEDLVPLMNDDGTRWSDMRTVGGRTFRIDRYRPRVEGLFARIERWTNIVDLKDSHWRSISRDNILTLYGQDAGSRISNPDNPEQIFSWLICETRDDKGNAIVYEYKSEDGANVDFARTHERNRGGRDDPRRTANRYIKRIYYGNRQSLLDGHGQRPPLLSGSAVQDTDWMFEVVFDYGEGHFSEDAPDDEGRSLVQAGTEPAAESQWFARSDPFSSYRAGFEVRTYRRCRRVLMFHHFPDEAEIGENCLVRSTDFVYSDELDSTRERSPIYTFLQEVTHSGYKRVHEGYLKKNLPPLEFEYTQPNVRDVVEEVDAESVENLPLGLDGALYQWTDLHGEGIPGILTEQAGGWFYKRNLSPLNEPGNSGTPYPAARFGSAERVALQPNLALAGGAQFMDLAGDGQPDLVMLNGSMPGFYEHDGAEGWRPFRPFINRLNRDIRDPNLKFVDLNGDGHADVLITEDDAFVWHSSLAEAGFAPAQRIHQVMDEEKGPRLLFADGTQSIYLADLSGDGLTDLVRLRNGEVCYWPNLGYGRFGAKISMDHAPQFDNPEQFDQRRIRLADIDGTGTTDIIYLHREGVRLYFNQSGNSWSAPRILKVFPRMDDLASIMPVDLLGNGTACLVWSSSWPGDARCPMRYIDLMGGQKPHLLVKTVNNLGAETRVHYAPSTKFYLRDKRDGRPWITRLPFPVHVIERVETYDHISRNRFVSRYAYHHGYFDGEEREFRGFGMVEQWDTEEFATLVDGGDFPVGDNIDVTSHVPPVHTKTWVHTGASINQWHISRQYEREYFREPGLTPEAFSNQLLPDTHLPDGLSIQEEREACRALKGTMLRQEVYADDAAATSSEESILRARTPYTVVERDFTIRCLQVRGDNRHAVFYTHPREAITYHYERNPAEPRVQHALTLDVDDFGNVRKAASVAYGRRQPDPDLPTDADRANQMRELITYTESRVTGSIDVNDAYRAPLPAETRTYELTGYTPTRPSGRFQSADFVRIDTTDLDGKKLVHIVDSEIEYHQQPTHHRQRRRIEHIRTFYRSNNLSGLLPLGEVESLALPGETCRLAFTPGLLTQVFQRNGQLLLEAPADVLGGQGADRGGYLDLDGDGHWWIPSGRRFYDMNADIADPAATAAEELSQARQHFFTERKIADPFGQAMTVTLDPYDLLMRETRDALGNTVTVGEREHLLPDGTVLPARPGNDYRVLQPWRVMDPNRNRSEVAFDALGMVVGAAVMGKPEETLGDSLEGFSADLAESRIIECLHDPLANSQAILGRATSRMVYDLFAYHRTKGDLRPQPAVVYTLVRETHDADLGTNEQPGVQCSFSYSDGFGREIQRKFQAEPGPVPQRDAEGRIVTGADGKPVQSGSSDPRWTGSGWTIFNNKGKPVRQFEPFFTDTHRFEFDVKFGVSPILFYDPLERTVATLHANHTYDKVVFNPWRQITWDVNDTVLSNLVDDADVNGFIQHLPSAEYLPSWYALRTESAHDLEASWRWPETPIRNAERQAAQRAALHAGTPAIAYFDTLGRPFLTLAHNGFHADGTPILFPARVELDIEGNRRAVRDAMTETTDAAGNPILDPLGRVVMLCDYDMLGNRTHQLSMEAGERWILHDAAGYPIRAWDSRGHGFRTEYDPLRRPLRSFVTGADPDNPNQELMTERVIHGEHHPEAEQRNLRGAIYQHWDQAGVVANEIRDFKGNSLETSRRLAIEYKQAIDWSLVDAALPAGSTETFSPDTLAAALAPLLENDTYTSRTDYDALNRVIALHSPDKSIIRPGYNEANLLERVDVNLRGDTAIGHTDGTTAAVWTPFVCNIDYDAKGQRTLIEFGVTDKAGNPHRVLTDYRYDPDTFRLVRMRTTRPHFPAAERLLQDLSYSYDPTGNITHIHDDAQQTVYFHGAVIEAHGDYHYDALYRLIQAQGREHIGQVNSPQSSWNDEFRSHQPHPHDGQAMRRYTERYQYDAVGNILSLTHQSQPFGVFADGSWTRQFAYDEASLIESGKQCNRLSRTTVGQDIPSVEPFTYDAHGNMMSMAHLSLMRWNFSDQLQATSRQVVSNGGTPEITWYVYDATGRRVRKVTQRQAQSGQAPARKEERIYLGGFEVYRKYEANGETVAFERETLHISDDKQTVALVETKTREDMVELVTPTRLIRFQFGNHLGSEALELDEGGEVISYEEHYPYGGTSFQATRHGVEVCLKRYRYSGKERDEESGLYNYGARLYAPWLGRWLSCDPGGLVDGPSLYTFVRGNPATYRDSGGRHTVPALPTPTPVPPGPPPPPTPPGYYSPSQLAQMGRQWTQSLLQLGARSAPITSGTPGLLAAASPAVIGGGAVVMVFTLVMLNPNTHIYGRAQPRLSSDERRRREVLGGGDPVTMYNPPFSAPGADGGLEIFDPLPDDTLLLPGPDHGPPVEAPGGTPSDPVIDPPSGGNESVEAGRDGTYGSERKKSNADPQNPCEADHMVPNAVNPIPCRQAPAVSMEKGDHRDWLTTGSSHEAQDIRELLKEMIQENPQDGYVNAHLLITQLYIDRFGMKYAEASYEGLLALDELGISEPLYDYSLSELEELGQDELVREHALCPGGCFRSK